MFQTYSIFVAGKVQGVFYRQRTKEKAVNLNIKGTVQNLQDGRVYICASGTIEQLIALIDWCWQGPSRASVTNVTHEVVEFKSFDAFTIEK